MTLHEVNLTGDCLQPINSTCSNISSLAAYVSLYLIATAVMMFTVCGNLLVIIAVYHFKQLHTPTNILIASLAISDCLVGLFVMPIHSIILIEPCSLFGSTLCAFYNMVNFQLTFVSVYNISFIAVDRYFALSNPFLYSKKVSLTVAIILTIHIWIGSLFYNCAILYFSGNFKSRCPDRCLLFVNEVWSNADLTLVFILPCATIVILYIKVFFIARRHAVIIRAAFKDRKRLNIQNNGDSMSLERKAAKVIGILVSLFLICLIPYYLCMLLMDVAAQSYDGVMNTMLTLFYLNSTINPIVYALFYPWFQKSMKLILMFRIFRTDSSLINVLSGDSVVGHMQFINCTCTYYLYRPSYWHFCTMMILQALSYCGLWISTKKCDVLSRAGQFNTLFSHNTLINGDNYFIACFITICIICLIEKVWC